MRGEQKTDESRRFFVHLPLKSASRKPKQGEVYIQNEQDEGFLFTCRAALDSSVATLLSVSALMKMDLVDLLTNPDNNLLDQNQNDNELTIF